MEEIPELRITRVPMPDWVKRPLAEVGPDQLGGQLEWHFATPWLFRALASPQTFEPVLAAPDHDDPHEQRRAYWAGLLYLLTYRLGWARTAQGITWWIKAGYPDEDPTLRLVKKVWTNDGGMHVLQAWLASACDAPLISDFEDACGYQPLPARRVPAMPPKHVGANLISGTPESLGPSQLHLEDGGHLHGGFDNSGGAMFLRTSSKQGKAVLFAESMVGWYGALVAHGNKLPSLGDRSWHVDVIVKPVGHLGTYRRSRASGIWFTGKHSVHLRGT